MTTKIEILKMTKDELKDYKWSSEFDKPKESSDCFYCSNCFNCSDCSDCYMCRNLREKSQYKICNVQLTKKEYEQKLHEMKT